MRKLAAAELLVFAAAMATTQGTLADEPVPLATISVQGYINASTNFGWYSGGFLNVSATPQVTGQVSTPLQGFYKRGIDCAKAYTNTGPGAGQGPRPGVQTYFVSNWGWVNLNTGEHFQTVTSTPSSIGGPWSPITGVTYGTYQSLIFMPENPSLAELVNTLAHEWSHQWGASEAQAYPVGDAAEQAFLADNGAKCGGL